MIHQPTLFDDPPQPEPDTLQARFETWLADNRHIYDLFLRAARSLKQQGRRRYGAKALVEWIRFHSGVVSVGDEFRVNNNYTSRLARLLLADFPEEFDGFLELRALKRE